MTRPVNVLSSKKSSGIGAVVHKCRNGAMQKGYMKTALLNLAECSHT